jgi:amino acid transporter
VRNVPRATLISVVGLGILYVITSFAFVSAFPKSQVIAEAQTGGPAFFAAMQHFGTHGLATIMQVLILTGSFACAMAFHNIAMRYFYAMGREGVLPRKLGKTHGVHKSPYIASIVQTVLAIAVVAAWGIDEGFDDPTAAAYVGVYGMMAVQGVVYILAIQALCAVAIIVYFQRHKHLNSNPLVTIVCPVIAIAAQIYAIVLLFKNIHAIAGTISYADQIWWIAIVGVVIAAAYAFYLKTQDREKYDLIGRVIDEGIA